MPRELKDEIREILSDMDSLAMEKAYLAIVKIISDRFVKKDLYKEKIAEINELKEKLTAATEDLSAAGAKVSALEKADKQRTEEKKEHEIQTTIKECLEENGASPSFLRLLTNELTVFIGDKNVACDKVRLKKLVLEKIKLLKDEFPLAFGTITVEFANVALRPASCDNNSNPWGRDSLNLEEQIRLFRENPALALEMAQSAGVRI